MHIADLDPLPHREIETPVDVSDMQSAVNKLYGGLASTAKFDKRVSMANTVKLKTKKRNKQSKQSRRRNR